MVQKENKQNKNYQVIYRDRNYFDFAAFATAATTPDVAANAAVTRDISKFELSAFWREKRKIESMSKVMNGLWLRDKRFQTHLQEHLQSLAMCYDVLVPMDYECWGQYYLKS